MRKLLILILSIFAAMTTMADERSQSVLRSVAEYVRVLGDYDAEFEVKAGVYNATGRYGVAGDSYHIKLDQAEVYSDGKVRYEVDHERKEVNIDVMDLSNRNILDNPTRCFDFVGADYASMVYEEAGGEITLLLRANDASIEGDIYLTVAKNTGRPIKIVYALYEDRIEVDITSLTKRKTAIAKYEASRYKGYEIVDFR